MAALDDLTAAVGALETASAAAGTEITTLLNSSDNTALAALTSRIKTVTNSLTGAIPAPPAPSTTSTSPTTITGPVGTPITGSFSTTGGTAPYTYSATGQPSDMTVNADGSYTVGASVAETATITLTVTDSSVPALVDTAAVSRSIS